MALEVMSAIVSSPTSSLNCLVDFPKPPSSVHTRPSKSSISNSMNNLLPPPLSSYLPMSPSKIDHQYIPTDPLYLPRYRPEQPFCLGEDISRSTQLIALDSRRPPVLNSPFLYKLRLILLKVKNHHNHRLHRSWHLRLLQPSFHPQHLH